jgi:hypothetical protein
VLLHQLGPNVVSPSTSSCASVHDRPDQLWPSTSEALRTWKGLSNMGLLVCGLVNSPNLADIPWPGSEDGTLTFPASLQMLRAADVEGYAVDFPKRSATRSAVTSVCS